MSYETSRLVSTQSRCLELVLLKHQYNHDHAIQASKFFLKFYIMVNLKANVEEHCWNFDKFLNFGSIQCSFKYLKKVLCTIEDRTNLTSFKCQRCAIKTGWKVSTLIEILILKQLFCWCKDQLLDLPTQDQKSELISLTQYWSSSVFCGPYMVATDSWSPL